MPVSRFDRPIGQDYISTYTPLPYQELADIAAKYQDKSDKNRMIPYEFDKLASTLQAAPYHQEYKDNVINKYKTAINDLVANTKDYASPEFQSKAMNLVSSFKNDKDVQTIQQSKQWFDKNYEAYTNNPKNARDLDFTIKKTPTGEYEQTNKGIYSIDTTPYSDHLKDVKVIMDNISEDGTPINNIKPYGNGYMLELVNGKTEFVSKEKVEGVASANIQNYANTEGGNYRMKQYIANQYGINPNKLDYETFASSVSPKEKQALDSYLYNDLYSYGKKQEFMKKDMHLGLHNDPLALDAAKEAKLAQLASTTPESISLNDKGSMLNTMPTELSKFYNKQGVADLTGGVTEGTKEAGDNIAKMSGWMNLDMSGKKGTNVNKNAAEYADQLFTNAAKILGTDRKEVAAMYNQEGKGLSWLKNVVENHYTNIALQKNTVATLQAPEQQQATSFFIGNKDRAMQNLGAAEITDLSGNLVDKKELIDNIREKDNEQGLYVRSIGFDKPGQIVMADKNGNSYYANTSYETLKKLTKPAVDINKGAEGYLKDFKLNDSQRSNLGIDKKADAPKFNFNYNGENIGGEAIDRQTYKVGSNTVDAVSIISRVSGEPLPFVYYQVYDNNGRVVSAETLTLEDYKTLTANQVISHPEFRAINREKENKVSFEE